MEKENNILSDSLKNIPLEIRLNVLNEITFINLITKLGYREEKYWTEDEKDKRRIISNLAKELTTDILNEIKEWENDGKPE
ncbi:MAG: hypothetical protein ACOC3V_01965 [bacterium]